MKFVVKEASTVRGTLSRGTGTYLEAVERFDDDERPEDGPPQEVWKPG